MSDFAKKLMWVCGLDRHFKISGNFLIAWQFTGRNI